MQKLTFMSKSRRVDDPEGFTVGLIQMYCEERPGRNLRKAMERIREAARLLLGIRERR